jgi:thioredoxin-like negative regulator of GroEL
MKVIKRFTASWCGPCKVLASNLKDIRTDIPIEVVDIDQDMATAASAAVRGVPTLIMYDSGTELKRHVGVMSASQFQAWVK